MHVIVVGAGLSGLLVAGEFRKRGAHVSVREASGTLGGVARTIGCDSYLLEPAVSSFLLPHPVLTPLLTAARIELVEVPGAQRRLYSDGDGYTDLPAGPAAFARTHLFAGTAKLRAVGEILVRSRTDPDESLEQFMVRRFGRQVGGFAAQLAAAGIFGAHPSQIDAAAYRPLIALESSYGSVLRGMAARRKAAQASGAVRPTLHAPRLGMAQMIDKLAAFVDDVRVSSPVERIEVADTHVRVDGESADAVIVTAPPRTAPKVSGGSFARDLPSYEDVAVVFLGGPSGDLHLPRASGLLAGPSARTAILGIVVESAPGRAPANHQLAKVLVGASREPSIAKLTDQEIVDRTIDDAGRLLGTSIRPTMSRVVRRRIPQYRPGHMGRVAVPTLTPRVAIGGWTQRGIGIGSLAADASCIADELEQSIPR